MNNKLRANNLFGYATSELSQDAFICWLLSHSTEEGWMEEPEIRDCAIEFLNKILKSKNLTFTNNIRIKIKKQYKNIDILVILGDIHIIIEDKTFTNSHNNQINKYKDTLVKEGIKEEHILCVYYKIIEQAFPEKNVDYEFTREILLDLFKIYIDRSGGSNPIFRDYFEYLEYIDNEVKSYEYLKIEKWTSYSYIGFYTNLRKTILKDEDTSWGYVSNPSGGFMGLWWFGILNNQDLNKIGLTEDLCEEVYLQVENDIITVKYSLDTEKYKNAKYDIEKIQSIKWKIYQYFKNIFGETFKKKSFKIGQYMTIGYINYNEINYDTIFTDLKQALINMKLTID